VAASVKASFGPFAVVGEVNAALRQATFLDGLGITKSMTPMTWQASIATSSIGTVGYRRSAPRVTHPLGYSGSKDMAGVTGLVNGVPTRFGFVPPKPGFLTAGEWVMDGLKVAVEYSAKLGLSSEPWRYGKALATTDQKLSWTSVRNSHASSQPFRTATAHWIVPVG